MEVAPPHPSLPLSVFLADDSAVVRSKLAALLSLLPGIRIGGEAETVAQAIEGVANHRPDVVILDLNLPDGSGLDALRAIKGKSPAPVVIILSMNPQSEFGPRCLKAGADFYCEKSVDLEGVLAIVESLARRGAPPAAPEPSLSDEGTPSFCAVLDSLTAQIVVLDERGTILSVNKAWRRFARENRLMGEAGADCIGSNYLDVCAFLAQSGGDERVRKAREGIQAVFEGRQAEFLLEYPCHLPTEPRSFLMRATPLVGPQRGVVVAHANVTERKQLEEQFLRAQRVEAIGTLAVGIAHDLNNILAPMLMASGLLKTKVSGAEDQSLIEMIEAGARRGAGIVRQLLAFSRGAGESGAAAGAVQAGLLLGEIASLVRETFPRNIVLDHPVATGLWPVTADPTQLHQVLMNLCVNARDAMPEGGQLSLRAENVVLTQDDAGLSPQARPGPYLILKVSDTGCGISPEIIRRIFDPFFTTKDPGQGTGLGLSTVLGIVRNLGGFVTVYSEPGRGSMFKVYLPATAGAEAVAAEEPAAPVGGNELVLLVDDEPLVSQAMRIVLERSGYRVVTAGNGAEGLQEFKKHRSDLRILVSDMSMPVMGGLAMIRSLRQLGSDIQVIALSGLDEPRRREELGALGVTEILVKPCESSSLLQALERMRRPEGKS